MIIKLVQDIRKSLEKDLYFAALISAIILPDICGKVEFPEEKSSRKRYILWYDKEIGKYEKNPNDKVNMPYLSGEVIYNLRCSLLHEGNPNVNNDKLNSDDKIDHFSLVIEKSKPFDIYSDSSAIMDFKKSNIRKYEMNVRSICIKLCNTAESYYKENKDKFHFNYEIIDRDETAPHFSPIDMKNACEQLAKNNELR